MSVALDINTWDHACPVLLPLDAPTMSTVFIASVGILVPFSIFVLAFFLYLHELWVGNASATGDAASGGDINSNALVYENNSASEGNEEEGGAVYVAVSGNGRRLSTMPFVDASQKRSFSRPAANISYALSSTYRG